jgi:hypothetical protein
VREVTDSRVNKYPKIPQNFTFSFFFSLSNLLSLSLFGLSLLFLLFFNVLQEHEDSDSPFEKTETTKNQPKQTLKHHLRLLNTNQQLKTQNQTKNLKIPKKPILVLLTLFYPKTPNIKQIANILHREGKRSTRKKLTLDDLLCLSFLCLFFPLFLFGYE